MMDPPAFKCCLRTPGQNNESARKRTLAQALRFVAHINGATLLFSSSKEKNLKDILRMTLNTVRSPPEHEYPVPAMLYPCWGRIR